MTLKLSKELKVGILSVASIVIFYIGFNFMKGIDFFSPTRTYYTVYDEIDGLTIANPVLLSGMPVGRVAEIKILQGRDNKVLVIFEVDKNIVLDHKTEAVLSNVDLLGSQAIILKIPDVKVALNDGDTVPGIIDLTITERLQKEALPVLQNLEKISNRITDVMDIIIKNEDHISATVANVSKISRNVENITNKNEEQVTAIVNNINSIAAMLNDEKDGLKSILDNVNTVTDSLKAVDIRKTVNRIDSTVNYVNRTLAKATESGGTIDKLLSDESVYNNLSKSLEDLDKLLIDMQENPKRYVHFSVFGRKNK